MSGGGGRDDGGGGLKQGLELDWNGGGWNETKVRTAWKGKLIKKEDKRRTRGRKERMRKREIYEEKEEKV